jgi:hypothetical protein
MAHGDSVAYPDYREDYRDAPCHAYTVGSGLGDCVQMQMTGNNFAFGNSYADEGPVEFRINKTQGFKEGPVRGAGYALVNRITAHNILLIFDIRILTAKSNKANKVLGIIFPPVP